MVLSVSLVGTLGHSAGLRDRVCVARGHSSDRDAHAARPPMNAAQNVQQEALVKEHARLYLPGEAGGGVSYPLGCGLEGLRK